MKAQHNRSPAHCCDGKLRFATHYQADAAARRTRRKGHAWGGMRRLAAYRCRVCGGWHVGSSIARHARRPMLRTPGPAADWRQWRAAAEEE